MLLSLQDLRWIRTAHSVMSSGKVVETWKAENKMFKYKVWSAPSGRCFVQGGFIDQSTREETLGMREKCPSISEGKELASLHRINQLTN